ncbi:MAG: STAS domain-containing protein [Gammaproteobacteria bacterium]
MALQIDINHKTDEFWEVSLTGSLDTDTATQLEKELAQIFVPDSKKLLFNMAGLEYVSSAGIRIIAMASKKMKENSGTIAMTGLQPQIEKIFEIVKALPNFGIFKDEAEADAYFDLMQKKVLYGD